MMEKIVCFSLGLSEEDIEKGKGSFYGLNRETPALEVMAITKAMLDLKVGEALRSMIAGSGINSAGKEQGADSAPDSYKYRVVIVLALERDQVLQVMRSFKAVLPDPQNIIFAVVTETALNWTFGEYIGHLGAEHESMKNQNLRDNPDMKKM